MKSNLIPVVGALFTMLTATSCAGLFGNQTCHCIYEGQCGYCPKAKVQRTDTTSSGEATDKEWLKELLNTDYSLVQYLPEEPQRMVWVDEPVTQSPSELTPYMSQSTVSGATRYMPKDVSMANSENAFYAYFLMGPDGKPEPLRLRVQYYADDPLGYTSLQVDMDGFDYYFKPASTKTGHEGKRMYWEYSDDALTAADKDLIYTLAHCKWARLKLKGAGGMNHVKMLTDEQLADFRHTLALYRALGGTL